MKKIIAVIIFSIIILGGLSIDSVMAQMLVENSSGVDLMIVTTSGNVGIGTTNPSTKLHVMESVRFEGLALGTTNTSVLTVDANGVVTRRTLSDWSFTDTDELVKASATDATAGYLNAKVTNSVVVSSDRLQLSGDAASPGNNRYYGTNASGTKGFHTLPAASNYWTLTGTNQIFNNNSGGMVGIGTTAPNHPLDVNGDLGIQDLIIHRNDTNSYIGFPANDQFVVRTNGANRITVAADGSITIRLE
ncbi:hypothetical protein JW935_21690 [candidate division KSB1 bacterium]|nr:hypothetical protein [candidate division KSB1 bacterium]